jgi:uncharacterized membrane protein YsdA (DUF1294 family)
VTFEAVRLVRDRYFLWNRLAVRLVEGMTMVALGRDPHGLGVAAAAACGVYDLLLGGRWSRAGGASFWPRLALDTCDAAIWSVALGHPADVAALIAAPLAFQAMWQGRWQAALVPGVVGGVTSAVLLLLGRPLEPAPFLWPSFAAVGGAVALRYMERRVAEEQRTLAAAVDAAAGQAELAGQTSIAMGADTIVDLLARTVSLLALGSGRPPDSPLLTWRAALAETAASRAAYLGVALTRWQRHYNSSSPDLSADVDLRWNAGAGTTLLSPAQVVFLDRALGALGLRGVVPVAVRHPDGPMGRERVLAVGRGRVVLPADPGLAAPALDPGPVVLLAGGVSILGQSIPWFEAVPLWVTVPLAAVAALLAWRSHRCVTRLGRRCHHRVLWVALVVGGLDAILSTLTMRHVATDNMVRLPYLLFLLWTIPLIVLYWRDLTRTQRGVAVAAAGAIVAAGAGISPVPVPLADLPNGAVWPAMVLPVALGLRRGLDRAASDVRADAERRREQAMDEAYRRGRGLVLRLTADSAEDARRLFAQVRAELPTAMAAEVRRRLAEVDRRLAELRVQLGPYPPSSAGGSGGAGRLP